MDTTDPDKKGRILADVDGVTMLQLLSDCSGAFQPGVLTALLGSSGAGKTTLMDVLCGRKTGESCHSYKVLHWCTSFVCISHVNLHALASQCLETANQMPAGLTVSEALGLDTLDIAFKAYFWRVHGIKLWTTLFDGSFIPSESKLTRIALHSSGPFCKHRCNGGRTESSTNCAT